MYFTSRIIVKICLICLNLKYQQKVARIRYQSRWQSIYICSLRIDVLSNHCFKIAHIDMWIIRFAERWNPPIDLQQTRQPIYPKENSCHGIDRPRYISLLLKSLLFFFRTVYIMPACSWSLVAIVWPDVVINVTHPGNVDWNSLYISISFI